jgi:hypothetical protein
MNLPSIPNRGKLDSVQGNPDGYVTKDGKWAAVPCGKQFVIICEGQQVYSAKTYDLAKAYIDKKVKQTPRKRKSAASLEGHFS